MTKISIGFLLLALLCNCSTNPVTGERQFSLMSEAQEIAIGQQNYRPYQQQQGGLYVVDPDLNLYVKRVGQSLARVSDKPDLPYDFVVLNSSVPNAWALPGGKIAINRGLLVLLEDEAQLAAVLGHEVVHAAARHSAQQMTQRQLLGIGTVLAGVALQDDRNAGLYGLGVMGAAALYQARYGRNQELEADAYGIEYMVEAGYEPRAAVELQETFVTLSQGKQASLFDNLFASHPPSQARVEKNIALTQALPQGRRNREAYQQAISQLKRDAAAYKTHSEALKAAKDKQFDTARDLAKRAIKMQEEESLFHITLGQIELSQKQFSRAETHFGDAKRFNPGYFMSTLGLGLAQKQQQKYREAKLNLEASLALLPATITQYELGEVEQALGNRSRAIRYFQSVAQSGGEAGAAARQKLNELGVATESATQQAR
jgi:predicted Zn-dependent protease